MTYVIIQGKALSGLGANTAPDSRVPTPWDNTPGRAKQGSPYVAMTDGRQPLRPGDSAPESGVFRAKGLFRQVGDGNNRAWASSGWTGQNFTPPPRALAPKLGHYDASEGMFRRSGSFAGLGAVASNVDTTKILKDGTAAFVAMGARGAILSNAGTDVFAVERGRQLQAFVSSKLPLFLKAINEGDGNRILAIQRAMDNITKSVADEELLSDTLIRRFLLLVVNPVLALLPPAVFISAQDAVTNARDAVEDVLQKLEVIPWYFYVGGGLVALGLVGYVVRSFR